MRFCFSITPEIPTTVVRNMSMLISKNYQSKTYSFLASITGGKSQEDEDRKDIIHRVMFPAITRSCVT